MADYIPKHNDSLTLTTSSDVTGGRLVVASGVRTVAHAADDAANVIGVAGHDALSGETVTVYLRGGRVHPLVASAAITAGARVVAEDAGKVQTIASKTNPIGVALQTAAADGDVIDVVLF